MRYKALYGCTSKAGRSHDQAGREHPTVHHARHGNRKGLRGDRLKHSGAYTTWHGLLDAPPDVSCRSRQRRRHHVDGTQQPALHESALRETGRWTRKARARGREPNEHSHRRASGQRHTCWPSSTNTRNRGATRATTGKPSGRHARSHARQASREAGRSCRQRTRWTATSQARRGCSRRCASERKAHRGSPRSGTPGLEAAPVPAPPAGEARAEEQPVSAAASMGRRTRGSARAARGERDMGVRSAQDGRMARRSSPRSPIGRWCVRREDTRAREVRLPPILFRRVTVTNMKARTIEL